MGIEFRLGRSDHKVVEGFLDGEPSGVNGISVDAPNVVHQKIAVEMARRRNVNVVIEPLTERLVEPGFDPQGLDYWDEYPIDLSGVKSLAKKGELVERVVGAQLEVASILVPPHFYVKDDPGLRLNIDLAGLTVQNFRGLGKPVRPILAISRAFLAEGDRAAQVAAEYFGVGIKQLDLRVSPLGGEDEGPVKVATTLQALEAFQRAGLEILLGFQPTIGHTAIALGLATGYSSGIGYREHYDHVAAIGQQRRPVTAGTGRRGLQAGVFLPGAGVTVPRWVGEVLYADPSIRTKLRCNLGLCATDIAGPAKAPREHYLHAHAELAAELSGFPMPWRPSHERDRLRRALELRRAINKHQMPKLRKTKQIGDLKTRTLETLAAQVDRYIERAKSA